MTTRTAATLVALTGLFCAHCSDRNEGAAEANESEYRGRDAAAEASPYADPPAPEPADVLDLGEVDTSGGTTTDVEFTLPSNVAGFQIVAQGRPWTYTWIVGLVAPNGAAIVEKANWGDPVLAGTEKVLNGDDFNKEGIHLVSVPQHGLPEALRPAAGVWTMRVRSQLDTVRVRVLLRRTTDGLPAPGYLDFAVYIPDGLVLDGETITVANAATSAPVTQRLDAYAAKLEEFWGIRLGSVRFAAIDERFRKIDDVEEAFDVGMETKIEGRLAHLVLSEENDIFRGISSGIPAVAAAPGTRMSHLILASPWRKKTPAEYSAVAKRDGEVLAHETGHYLGIFHTTERDGSDFDPLDDTPQCDTATITADYKTCPDYENVMFGGGTSSPRHTSPLQRQIVQSSPLLRGTSIQPAARGGSGGPDTGRRLLPAGELSADVELAPPCLAGRKHAR